MRKKKKRKSDLILLLDVASFASHTKAKKKIESKLKLASNAALMVMASFCFQ